MGQQRIKLNLGCGAVRPKGWVNTDSSLNATIQKVPFIGKKVSQLFSQVKYSDSNVVFMNLNKTWNYSDNSVDVVYASHLFEHLTRKAASIFLKESFRTLKPGGVIRLVVPDLYKICKRYIDTYEHSDNNDPTEFIMWAINMDKESQYGGTSLFKSLLLELQGYPHQHKYMYDDRSLGFLLRKQGFEKLQTLSYGISKYLPEIADVEGTEESYLSVYLEGLKPKN